MDVKSAYEKMRSAPVNNHDLNPTTPSYSRRSPEDSQPRPPLHRNHPAGATPVCLAALASFEFLFCIFLYSNNIKYFLPPMIVDETVVFFALCVTAFGIVLYRTGIRIAAIPLLISTLLFMGWLVVTAFWTVGYFLTLRSIGFHVVINLFCLLVGALGLAGDRVRLGRYVVFVALIGSLLSIHGLWIYANVGTFRYYDGLGIQRAYLSWTAPVATAAAMTWPFALNTLVDRRIRLAAFGVTAVFGGFLAVAGARGAFLSFVITTIVAVMVYPIRIRRPGLVIPKPQIYGIVFMVAIACVLVVSWNKDFMVDTRDRFISLFYYVTSDPMAERYERLAYFRAAISYWLDAPLIGNGIGSFGALYMKGIETEGAQPHNIVLELLCETGLLGLTLFGAMVLTAARGCTWERLRGDPLYCGLWLFMIGVFGVRAMTVGDLAGQWEFFVTLGALTMRDRTESGTGTAGARPAPMRNRAGKRLRPEEG